MSYSVLLFILLGVEFVRVVQQENDLLLYKRELLVSCVVDDTHVELIVSWKDGDFDRGCVHRHLHLHWAAE